MIIYFLKTSKKDDFNILLFLSRLQRLLIRLKKIFISYNINANIYYNELIDLSLLKDLKELELRDTDKLLI